MSTATTQQHLVRTPEQTAEAAPPAQAVEAVGRDEASTSCCDRAPGQHRAPVARRPRGERLDRAADVVGVCLLVVVPVLAWWALGRVAAVDLWVRLAVSVLAGVLAAVLPIYLTTYLVNRRRSFRRVDAEIDARWHH